MKRLPIKTWYGNATYYARILQVNGFRASCTAGPDQAARAVARKYYGDKATVRKLTLDSEREALALEGDPKQADQIRRDATHVIEVSR